jgi:deoxyhypusine synthase
MEHISNCNSEYQRKHPEAINSNMLMEKLTTVIPTIISRIVSKNIEDGIDKSTKFDCSSRINVNFQDYLKRLIQYSEAESNTLIYCLALMDMICETKKVYLTTKNIHKLFLVALVIAIKALEDEIFAESHYAYIGGISSKELAKLEHEFLSIMDYKINISKDKFTLYYKSFF